MHRIVNDEALDILFRAARGRLAWLAKPVSDTLLRAIWELVKLGPTSGLADPVRIVFARSENAKARLAAGVAASKQAVIARAPTVAIVAFSIGAESRDGAVRDGALYAAYLILAARALGFDCEPIWQLDTAAIDRAFFPDGRFAAGSLCVIGYGDDAAFSPSAPRSAFDEACTIL